MTVNNVRRGHIAGAPPLLVLIPLAYIAVLTVLYVSGAGIIAAYLTMPAWSLIGAFVFLVLSSVPSPILQAVVTSWAGNLVLLVASGLVNVGSLYLFAFLLHRRR